LRGLWVLAVLACLTLTACTAASGSAETPGLAPRDTTWTTVKPSRQDLSNKVSLTGKVELNPTFGIEAPVGGQVRYLTVAAPTSTPSKPTRVAGVWVKGRPHYVNVPAGAVFAGRLVDDRSTVVAGTPIVSARYAGYGITADIDAGQAYQISGFLTTAQAQIKNGPGPFPCTVLGTIAALPAGTIPQPPPAPAPSGAPAGPVVVPPGGDPQSEPQSESAATGMRLVCTPPADVKMINGASVTLSVVTESAKNVLVLPVEAVAGGHGKGKVDVVRPDRTRETRDVVLGLTDGKVIEIKSGLTGDEEIAVPAPNLPAAPPNNGGGAGLKVGPS
jgi:hypothetical protein